MKTAPSGQPEGAGNSRKLYLRAANDNHAPLGYRLKKMSVIGLPLLVVGFFAAVWYFRGF